MSSTAAPVETRSPAEVAMRRALRVGDGPNRATQDQANRLASTSIALSAVRCLLTYVILPVVLPVVGWTAGAGAAIGVPVSLLALVFDVLAIRRFWAADHPWRWRMTVVYAVLIVMVFSLFVVDLVQLA